ncbi:MAG: M28 family peptidase [Acidobacteria bacterium]|nr:M28 family peptidase [Acidobacteriota bacterium]
MKHRLPLLALLLVAALALPLLSQEREDRTLLSWTQMRAIINEASGERALHHLLEMVPYPRVRDKAEYQGTFRESEVMARFAKEYGYSNVEIETFPTQGRSWFASQAELWMVEPESRKLYDVYDVAIAIVGNSESGDITAELVDVGFGGRAEDYAGKDVKGKIVLGSASTNVLQRMAVFERDAVGVIGYNTVRPASDLDQILSQGISANAPQGKKPGFGWAIAPRVARELAMRLRNEKIVLRSIVKSDFVPGEMETVHAMIPGDGSTEQDIIVSGHLYEGYLKQGANDDGSGCAVTLEMGRTLIRLINEGKLPKPKRNIHFLWVPEISGTRAWLQKHADTAKRIIADLNFDMEGLHLSRSGSIFTMNRTPDSFPSFLNDIGASLMDFVMNTNKERVQYRSNGYRFTLPITAPNGSNDPFWASVDKHYGASDHVVYMSQGIPAVIFCTWPDTWYHSSQDTPDKMDSTQFKRVAVIGAAGAIIMAAADDDMAARVAAESLARGTERMGAAQRKGLSYLTDLTDSAAMANAYREARVTVSHQTNVEKEVVRSASVLFLNPEEAKKKLSALETLVDQRGASLQNEVKAFYQITAEQKKVPAAEPATSDAMAQAAKLIPESVGGPGGGFGGGGGGGAPGQQLAPVGAPQISAEERAAAQAAMRKVPQHMTAELNALLTRNATRKRTVLEIRDFLSGEFEPLPLEDLMGALKAREKLGSLKFTEKPEEPKPAPARKGKPAKKP